jgi:hypothetical protein
MSPITPTRFWLLFFDAARKAPATAANGHIAMDSSLLPCVTREYFVLCACEQFHSAVVASAAILSNVLASAGALIMEIASHTSTRSHLAVRNSSGWYLVRNTEQERRQ